MTTEKIFIIIGRETLNIKAKKSKKNNCWRDRSSEASNNIYWNGLHVLTILFTCGLGMSIPTMIPRHNSILEQKYWYQILIPVGFGSIIWTAVMFLDLIVFTDMKYFKSIKFFVKTSLASLVAMVGSYCFCYIFWTKIIEYNHPMPLVVLVCVPITMIVSTVSLRFFSPAVAITKDEYREKLRNHFLFVLLWLFVVFIQVPILRMIFQRLENTNAQCIVAILIPASKICNKRIFSKIVNRISGIENETANAALAVAINICFGMIVATRLVKARYATVGCMIIVELMVQLAMSYRIITLHKKVVFHGYEENKAEKKKVILKLVLAELCEGLIPLAYAICFAMAYYGPNANLIGNVRNDYWQYKAVDDPGWTFVLMFGMFSVDLVSLFLNASIIWITCNVNLFKEICIVLQKYWFIMALKMTHNTYYCFLSNDVNLAMDWTLNFDWLKIQRNVSSTEI